MPKSTDAQVKTVEIITTYGLATGRLQTELVMGRISGDDWLKQENAKVRVAVEAIESLIKQAELRARIDELKSWIEFLNPDHSKDVKWINQELQDRVAELQQQLSELEANE